MTAPLAYRDLWLEAQVRISVLETENAVWRSSRSEPKVDPETASIGVAAMWCAGIIGKHHSWGAGHVLRLLLKSPGCVLSNAELFDGLGCRETAGFGTIKVHVCRLRAALRGHGFPDAVRTFRGTGYMLFAHQAKVIAAAVKASA
jgi:hypothetical protein